MAIDKTLKERLSKIEQIRKDLKSAEKTAAKQIMAMLKSLMADNPLLVAMRWKQYTPSFNDGDVCEFTIDGPYFKFDESVMNQEAKLSSDDESDDDYDNDNFIDDYAIDDFLEKRIDILNHKDMASLKKAVKDAQTVFNKLTLMESVLIEMFDNGAEVTVTSDGVETEEYYDG